MNELKKWIIKELPINEWWKDGYLVYMECAKRMKKAGMETEEIKEILENLYSATCSEYE